MALKGRTYIESHSVKYRCQRCHQLVFVQGETVSNRSVLPGIQRQEETASNLTNIKDFFLSATFLSVSQQMALLIHTLKKYWLGFIFFLNETELPTLALSVVKNNSADRSCRSQTVVWSHPVYLSRVDRDTFDPAVWETSATAYSLSPCLLSTNVGQKVTLSLESEPKWDPATISLPGNRTTQ